MAATRNEHTTKGRGGRILVPLDGSARAEQALFASWGSEKPAARARRVVPVKPESIRSRMQVYDHEGMHLGQVKEVRDVDFTVDRPWRADIRLPIKRVLAVMDQRVFLNAA
jgi:hypothetical protein